MSNRLRWMLPRLTLAVLILAALVGVVKSLTNPPPTLAPRLTLQDSAGYLLAGFAPDGRMVAGVWLRTNDDRSTQWAGPLRLWDTNTGRLRATVALDLKACWPPLRFTPDGKYMAIEGPGVLKFWEVETGLERAAVELGKNRYLFDANFAFSADSQTLAVGSAGSQSVQLLDLATGKVRATLAGAFPPLRFAPDGGSLATASAKGVTLWDAATARSRGDLPGEGLQAQALAFAPDGRRVAAGGVRKEAGTDEIRIWDVAAGAGPAILLPPCPALGLTFSSDGAVLLAWDNNLTPGAWDVSVTPPQQLPAVPPGYCWQPALDGKTLVGRRGDGGALWDVVAGKERGQYWAGAGAGYPPIVSPDGRYFAVEGHPDEGGWLQSLLGGPPQPVAATGGEAPRVLDVTLVLDATSGRARARLEQAGFVDFSPDGRTAASTWGMEAIRLWDVPQEDIDSSLRWNLTTLGILLAIALGWWIRGRVRFAPVPVESERNA